MEALSPQGVLSTADESVPANATHKRRWKRAVLVGLLALLALVIGWRWSAGRLNATEKKLVGVWVQELSTHADHYYLLPDGDIVMQAPGLYPTERRWRASDDTFYSLERNPASIKEWCSWLRDKITGGGLWATFKSAMVFHSDDHLELRSSNGHQLVLQRSHDPELLHIFDRLSAGETPEQIEAELTPHSHDNLTPGADP